jgi:hypothetical protein
MTSGSEVTLVSFRLPGAPREVRTLPCHGTPADQAARRGRDHAERVKHGLPRKCGAHRVDQPRTSPVVVGDAPPRVSGSVAAGVTTWCFTWRAYSSTKVSRPM